MSIRHCVTVAAIAAFVLGSAPTIVVAGSDNKSGAEVRAGSTGDSARQLVAAAEQTASLARQAPIGHRQPRAVDVPGGARSSPLELEQRRQDEELDRRLIICRGC
jgi:hypothetical protein